MKKRNLLSASLLLSLSIGGFAQASDELFDASSELSLEETSALIIDVDQLCEGRILDVQDAADEAGRDCEQAIEALYNVSEGWLLPTGTERWDAADLQIDTACTYQICQTLEELGFFEEKRPAAATYDAVVIIGASAPALERRFGIARELIIDGDTKTKIIACVCGERELSEMPEPAEKWPRDRYRREVDVAHHMMKDMFSDYTDATKMVLETSKISMGDETRRPNSYETLETLKLFFSRKGDDPKKILLVTNQPYGYMHFLRMKTIFPKAEITLAASSARAENIAPSVLVDMVTKVELAERRLHDLSEKDES